MTERQRNKARGGKSLNLKMEEEVKANPKSNSVPPRDLKTNKHREKGGREKSLEELWE